jgi:hypothetical protein
MAKKLWLDADGKLLVDASGRPYFCEECPCDGATECCELAGNCPTEAFDVTLNLTLNEGTMALPVAGPYRVTPYPNAYAEYRYEWNDDTYFIEVRLMCCLTFDENCAYEEPCAGWRIYLNWGYLGVCGNNWTSECVMWDDDLCPSEGLYETDEGDCIQGLYGAQDATGDATVTAI